MHVFWRGKKRKRGILFHTSQVSDPISNEFSWAMVPLTQFLSNWNKMVSNMNFICQYERFWFVMPHSMIFHFNLCKHELSFKKKIMLYVPSNQASLLSLVLSLQICPKYAYLDIWKWLFIPSPHFSLTQTEIQQQGEPDDSRLLGAGALRPRGPEPLAAVPSGHREQPGHRHLPLHPVPGRPPVLSAGAAGAGGQDVVQ